MNYVIVRGETPYSLTYEFVRMSDLPNGGFITGEKFIELRDAYDLIPMHISNGGHGSMQEAITSSLGTFEAKRAPVIRALEKLIEGFTFDKDQEVLIEDPDLLDVLIRRGQRTDLFDYALHSLRWPGDQSASKARPIRCVGNRLFFKVERPSNISVNGVVAHLRRLGRMTIEIKTPILGLNTFRLMDKRARTGYGRERAAKDGYSGDDVCTFINALKHYINWDDILATRDYKLPANQFRAERHALSKLQREQVLLLQPVWDNPEMLRGKNTTQVVIRGKVRLTC